MPARDALSGSTEEESERELSASAERERRLLWDAVRSSTSGEPQTEATGELLPAAGEWVAERFVIEHELGRGGMGVVFAARDERMGGRRVALKWLRMGSRGRSATTRLLREALAAIDHPNVVRIYDVDVAADDRPFLVMELLHGKSLDQRLREGAFAIDEACEIILQVMEGLAAVHAHGLVHRDLKPANIFLTHHSRESWVPKILDFGIVKWSTGAPAQWTVTAEGAVIGTPAYMAPEQLRGGVVDARADIYALSVVLYEMLTRRLPFAGATAYELGAQVLAGGPLPPSSVRAGLPLAVERVLLKGLSLHPEDRHHDVPSMAEALRAALAEVPHVACSAPPRRRRRAATGAVGVVSLLAALVAWTARDSSPPRTLPPPLPRVLARGALPLPALPAGALPADVRLGQPSVDRGEALQLQQVANEKLQDFVELFRREVVPASSVGNDSVPRPRAE